jgi:hypothetical protein
MPKKRKSGGKRSQPKDSPAPRLKRAVPPPDNPMLREASDAAARASGMTEEQMARLRAKALEQAEEDT